MADGTTQAIETVKPGDRVISYDYESGERTISVVGESLTHTRADTDHWNEGYYHIHTASGKELKVTENHPVAVPRDGQTVHATVDDLNEGDLLRTIQGSSVRNDRIESMDYHDAGLSVVYNLDMERGPENYFVGDGTLVFTGEEAQQFEQLNRRPLPIKR
jgi:intein/homing endonuclease